MAVVNSISVGMPTQGSPARPRLLMLPLPLQSPLSDRKVSIPLGFPPKDSVWKTEFFSSSFLKTKHR